MDGRTVHGCMGAWMYGCADILYMHVCMHGMAWHGMAWHGMAWHGMAWHGMACNAAQCSAMHVQAVMMYVCVDG